MSDTPNLPPLPPHDKTLAWDVGCPVYRTADMQAYALAAYQAGREATLEEVAAIANQQYVQALSQREAVDGDDDDNTEAWNLSMTAQAAAFTRMETEIRRLKSDAKAIS